MAYSKHDFINFNDLDLDALLGDYTCSDIECSDNEELPKSKKLKSDKTYVYTCDSCDKKYTSMSGIRGHLRSKHGATNIRVSDYRIKSPSEHVPARPFQVDSDFDEYFHSALHSSLQIISNSTLRKTSSFRGKTIVDISEEILRHSDIYEKVQSLLLPKFKNIMEKVDTSADFNNEVLFSNLYSLSADQDTLSTFSAILEPISSKTRQFYGVLCHGLMKELVKSKSNWYEKTKENCETNISNNDQQVIYYISGYLMNVLARKCAKEKESPKQEAFQEAIQKALRNENDSEKTFVSKYNEWTEKINRGGLRFASDNFFLIVRQFETVCREEIDETHVTKDTLNKAVLVEKIMSNVMVRHYLQKIITGEYAVFFLEKCVNLFLTVRGHAWARKFKTSAITDKNNKKALRTVLKEKSNVN